MTPFKPRHLALVLLLGGCLPKLSGEAGEMKFPPPPPSEAALFGGEPPRYGLALSGGGIRSALFSAGVMKAMYDIGALDSVQIISTVSGGGYNAYWVYSREVGAAGSRFGDATFSNAQFKTGLCEVALTGNFVPLTTIAGTALTSLVGRGFRTMYQDKLHRTFGPADSMDLQIHQLLPHTRRVRGDGQPGRVLPYWVINTTVLRPKPDSGWADGLFEMTPLHHGNHSRGYLPWGTTSIPLLKAVAISGAAQAPLKQRVTFDASPSVVLADGGGSENLAAIALVRRRVRNIIIVDGEQDPDHTFVGYRNLKKRLESWGYAFHVDYVDSMARGAVAPAGTRHMPRAVYPGYVRSGPGGDGYEARVLYVKLTVPQSLDQRFADSGAIARGDTLWERVFEALEASPDSASSDWKCKSLEPITGSYDDFFTSLVHHYSEFNYAKHPGRRYALNGMFSTDFPHLSTILLQSMYLDMSTALVGAGYLIGKTDLQPALDDMYGAAR